MKSPSLFKGIILGIGIMIVIQILRVSAIDISNNFTNAIQYIQSIIVTTNGKASGTTIITINTGDQTMLVEGNTDLSGTVDMHGIMNVSGTMSIETMTTNILTANHINETDPQIGTITENKICVGSGTTQVNCDSNITYTGGKMGIETAAPIATLHTNGDIYMPAGNSYWIGSIGDAGKRVRLHNISGNSYIDFSSGPLIFRMGTTTTGQTEKMRITSTGLSINGYLTGTTITTSGITAPSITASGITGTSINATSAFYLPTTTTSTCTQKGSIAYKGDKPCYCNGTLRTTFTGASCP